MKNNRAVFYVNFAVFLFGSAGLFAKWLSLPAIGITFGRVCISAAALFFFCAVTRQSLKIQSRRHFALFLGARALLALHWWLFLEAVQLSTVAIGTLTFAAFPLFVTFLEPLFFKEKLEEKNVLAAVFILLGVLITVPEFTLENSLSLGILLGMASSLAYAFLTLINRYFSNSYSGTVIAFYEQGWAALWLTPSLFFLSMRPTLTDWGFLLFLGVITTALAHTLFISSLKSIPARLAGVISSMEAVYGILLAFVLLGETPSLREIAGGTVIIGVVIFSQLQNAKAKQ